MNMSQAASLFKAAGDITRLRVLKLLSVRECCVCELSGITGLSNSTISEHLKKLKGCGLVKERKKSYWSYYSLILDGEEFKRRFTALLDSLDDPQFVSDSEKLLEGSFTCRGVVMEKPYEMN